MFNGFADALAVAAAQQQGGELGFHTGVIRSWDELTGANTVEVGGTSLTNLSVLSAAGTIHLRAGDTVAVMRVRTQYFILGKIAAPGASAAERIASDRVARMDQVPTTDTFVDLPSYGPEVSLYIGSSRRALVIHSAEFSIGGVVDVGQWGEGHQAVQITGASNRPVESAVTNAFLKGNAGTASSASATTFITSVNGLREGVNTFTCKYRATANGQQDVVVNNRVLTVIPF